MEIEIRSVSFAGQSCRTRLPFRFGVVTLTQAPLIVARVSIHTASGEVIGYASDLAVPRWFDKNPARSADDDIRALFASARRAAAAFLGQRGTAFSIWRRCYGACVGAAAASGVPLVDGFGVALVERAMLDALCRAAGLSFREALEQDLFAFEPGTLLPKTAGLTSRRIIATPAPEHVLLRHTVGGLDPLRANEVSEELRGRDRHPVALEDDIAHFGLRAFKLKAGGDPKHDALRLADIARVVAAAGVREPLYTLDANEQYADLAQLGRLLDGLDADPDGRAVLSGLHYIEQPLPRAQTLDPATSDEVRAIAQAVPLLIDEADDGIDAFPRALDIGYRGVSVKNCKGVFRALTNRALCVARGEGSFQTSEDLTNLPVLALQQDLSTLAALGLTHSERNGHHFFPGLDVVPNIEAETALAAHPDLYERRGERIVMRVEGGSISLACLHAVGYGYASQIDWPARASLEALENELPR